MLQHHDVDMSVQLTAEDFRNQPPTKWIEDPLSKLERPKQIQIERQPYLPKDTLVEDVNLAIALGRPLLLQGEPGSGKTSLAYAVAYALGRPLEIAYIKSTSRAQDLLYQYDAIKRLYDAQIPRSELGDKLRAPAAGRSGYRLEPAYYIQLGPLGRAIARTAYGRRSIVLIDEIDKADLDFPNDLLWELDKLEFSIAELKGKTHRVTDRKLWPIVFITHNQEKELPAAFLRRCIFHLIEFPGLDELQQILDLHRVADGDLSKRAIEVVLELRGTPDLAKPPGLSELLEWVGYLHAVNAPASELRKLPYAGALLKQQDDQKRAREALNRR